MQTDERDDEDRKLSETSAFQCSSSNFRLGCDGPVCCLLRISICAGADVRHSRMTPNRVKQCAQ